jgi:hypothetical protein
MRGVHVTEIPKTAQDRAYQISLEELRRKGMPLIGLNRLQEMCKERFGIGGTAESMNEGRQKAHQDWLREQASQPQAKPVEAERVDQEGGEEPKASAQEGGSEADWDTGQKAQVAVMKEFIDGAVVRILAPIQEAHKEQIADLRKRVDQSEERYAQVQLRHRLDGRWWLVGGVLACTISAGAAYWIGHLEALVNVHNQLKERSLPEPREGGGSTSSQPQTAPANVQTTPTPTVVSPAAAPSGSEHPVVDQVAPEAKP